LSIELIVVQKYKRMPNAAIPTPPKLRPINIPLELGLLYVIKRAPTYAMK
jgi:hypothetical protein